MWVPRSGLYEVRARGSVSLSVGLFPADLSWVLYFYRLWQVLKQVGANCILKSLLPVLLNEPRVTFLAQIILSLFVERSHLLELALRAPDSLLQALLLPSGLFQGNHSCFVFRISRQGAVLKLLLELGAQADEGI